MNGLENHAGADAANGVGNSTAEGAGDGTAGAADGGTGNGAGTDAGDRAAGGAGGIDGGTRAEPLTQNVAASRPTSANAPPSRAEPRPRINSHRLGGARSSHEKPRTSMYGHHQRSGDYDYP
ncbi:hypothetical protein [Streptosporangium sp. NPDC051022]|uniref:hypothetical protein n=1 Tax=Streptosporangium sp. NPDC051022 TaxID=3155752 RepID=UPI003445CA18